MENSKNQTGIAIIGMGFCGLMTAVHLLKKARTPFALHLINSGYPFGNGIAYSTKLSAHLLNVPASKMSCFPSLPDHFLNWVHSRAPYSGINKEILGKTYVPRKEYGKYLLEVWNETLKENNSFTEINIVNSQAADIEPDRQGHKILFESHDPVIADYVILATGNDTPAAPDFINGSDCCPLSYFSNPWDINSATDIQSDVLILGNSLTMIDTVLTLLDTRYKGKIYSISPNGFGTLPHSGYGIEYTNLLDELHEPYEIDKLYHLFRKHIKFVKQFGLTAQPVIDSVRPVSQKIWLSLSTKDKKRFLVHLKHLWNTARHRVPSHIHDLIQDLEIKGKLVALKGKVIEISGTEKNISVRFLNKSTRTEDTIAVSRIINCTGPLLDMNKTRNELIKSIISRGTVRPDALRLGIDTDIHGATISSDDIIRGSIFTLGGNLRGLLWESTAVPELRVQAENLASLLLDKIERVGEPASFSSYAEV